MCIMDNVVLEVPHLLYFNLLLKLLKTWTPKAIQIVFRIKATMDKHSARAVL